jgi:hypothetical protein
MTNKRIRYIVITAIILPLLFLILVITACFIPATLPVKDKSTEVTIINSALEELATEATTEIIQNHDTIEKQEPVLNDIPVLFSDISYITCFDTELGSVNLENTHAALLVLEQAVESGDYTDGAVSKMNKEIIRLSNIISSIEADIERHAKWEQEYYYATNTYKFLRQRGYNHAVTCGIIGNMMIETAGGTLMLNPTIYNPTRSFYGLCQWSLYYRPEVAGISFEEQLEYLDMYMYKEFDTFGFCYKKDFTYEDFLTLEDPAEAALAFAKVYERCASGSYNLRKTAAITAHEYFNYN